ncbi:class I SAM-dependent methyltransferase [Patescibacteria group bacterium]|nr:class I SAM-dependent methyltransferase [Patescibacteria group bacterium]
MKQGDKIVYAFGKYTREDRWASYYYQIREILEVNPSTLLEVGIGEGVLMGYLKSNTNISYTSLDVADDLHPDVVGNVTKIPFTDSSFDTVCAFEVLEHLPFEHFELALQELKRVSKKHVVISLPHFGPPVLFLLKLPFLRRIQIAFKIPYPQKHVFNGQHHWEIGKKSFPQRRIRKTIRKYFSIIKEFIPFENQYHHFFILEK